MKHNYTIEEILEAVDDLQNKKNGASKNKLVQKDVSEVPKSTLRLIEEAENTIN